MSTIRRLSLRSKLLAGFGLVLLLIAVLSVVSLSKMRAIERGSTVANETGIPSVETLKEVDKDLTNLRAHQWQFLVSEDAGERPKLLKEIASDRREIAEGFTTYATNDRDADTRRLAAEAEAAIGRYVERAAPALTAANAGRRADAERALDNAQGAFDDVQDALDAWLARRATLTAASYEEAKATTRSATRFTIVLTLLALAVGVALALLLSRSINRGVTAIVTTLGTLRDHCATELGTGLRRLADGDLTYVVTPATPAIASFSGDEIGDIARSTNAIRESLVASIEAYNESRAQLGTLVGQVTLAAGHVSSGSRDMAVTSEEAGRAVGEIAHAIGEVAIGAQRQVAAVEAASRTADEVSAVTEQSARTALDTADAAEGARTLAATGSAAAEHAGTAMVAVRTASREATQAIRDLGAKSGQIGSIVDTIGGIAEQTNLLALNAAIEAARAGEQGRGFAVVAEEVRKLAEESQAAARSIGSLIGEIQTQTEHAIAVVESGAERTGEGVATVDEARAAFREIGTSVDDVSTRVGQIAAALQQVAASTNGMRDGMLEVSAVAEESSAATEQVSASTQQTTASAQQIGASATELARTAEDLEALVQRFTLVA